VTRPAIAARGLTVRFGDDVALDDVSLDVDPGEVFVIMGPSGSGKSTLLRSLIGLEEPSGGEVRLEGEPIPADPDARSELYRRVGLVFQDGALLSSLTVRENVALPMRSQLDLPERLVAEAARLRLAEVGLADAGELLPAELSGGMRKRAGIARALALEPRLLFFDEPTAGLDPPTAAAIDALVLAVRRDLDATCVVVTHDLASAERIADRVLVLNAEGRPCASGTWDEIEARRGDDPALDAFLGREATGDADAAGTALGPRPKPPDRSAA